MSRQKQFVVLLALLLTAMIMVPMVAATTPDIYPQSYARTDESDHLFGGRGDYNQGGNLYDWVVKVELKNPAGTVVQTEWESCPSGNDCSTSYRYANIAGHAPGTFTVLTTVWANGVGARTALYSVYFP
ncbi:MAG: hypothetical protein WC586_11105 [Methanoregula sp.]